MHRQRGRQTELFTRSGFCGEGRHPISAMRNPLERGCVPARPGTTPPPEIGFDPGRRGRQGLAVPQPHAERGASPPPPAAAVPAAGRSPRPLTNRRRPPAEPPPHAGTRARPACGDGDVPRGSAFARRPHRQLRQHRAPGPPVCPLPTPTGLTLGISPRAAWAASESGAGSGEPLCSAGRSRGRGGGAFGDAEIRA